MPLTIDPELVAQLVQRQVQEEQMQERFAPKTTDAHPEHKDMSPSLIAALGAAADGASTYSFLKQGTGAEDNAMFSGLKDKPAATALAAAGTGLAVPLLGRLLKNKLPKGLVDAIVANMGARTLAVAGANADGGIGESSFSQVNKALADPQLRNR